MKRLYFVLFLVIGTLHCFAQQSQNELFERYADGLYHVYMANDKGKLEQVAKEWPIQIIKNSGTVSKILLKRSGILDENFVPDVPGYPAYYYYKNYRLTFLPEYVVYYEWNAKQEAKVKYIFVKEGERFKASLDAANAEVQKYVTATFANQSSAKATRKADQAKEAEAERKQNSLAGKEVTKLAIQFVDLPDQIAQYGKAISYGVIATLQDGTQLKTANLGGKMPWEDFELHHIGCTNLPEIVQVETDAAKIPNDEIVLNIVPKAFPKLKISKKIVCTYDVPIQLNRNGVRGMGRGQKEVVFQGVDGQDGGPAENLTVKVTAGKHNQTGKAINKIQVYSNSRNEVIAQLKLDPSTSLVINSIGGAGMNGRKGYKSSHVGGKGGNGGNGGHVTIIKDPSVKSLDLEINNQGGAGGKGGPAAQNYDSPGADGSAGRNGTRNTKTENVLLDF